MPRFFVFFLLLFAGPLAAQAADGRTSLPSGTAVRVFLRDGAPGGARGVLVSGTADSLRVISPALGLAQLPADGILRLEAGSASSGRALKYAAVVLGLSALAGAAGGEDAFPMFMNGVIGFGLAGGVLYVMNGPGERAVTIHPADGLPAVRQDADRPGVPVRIATRTLPLADHRLRDFSADSVFLVADGSITPLPRVEITSLQVSLGRDRRRGARKGALMGGVAGAVLAGGALASQGDFGLLMSPFAALGGGLVGAGLGVPVGSALAPREWKDVPVRRPER
jgi:hypothetical protein